MTRLLTWLILLAVFTALVLGLQSQGGAVSIWWSDWRVDFALSTGLFLLAAALVFTTWLNRSWRWLFDLPLRWKAHRAKQQDLQRVRALSDLGLDFAEGRYARVLKGAEQFDRQFEDMPGPRQAVMRWVFAMAARAAHALSERPVRDQYLRRLDEGNPRDLPHPQLKPLLEAEFALDEQRGQEALAALAPVMQSDRKHIYAMRLVLRAHEQAGQWMEVLRVTRLLDNRKALHPAVVRKTKARAFSALLKQAGQQVKATQGVIDLLSRDERHDPELAALASKALLAFGLQDKARSLLESGLRQGLDDRLLEAYAECHDAPAEQYANLEKWAVGLPRTATLHWALGRLSQAQGLWGKAHVHLEQALNLRPSLKVCLALGETAHEMGDHEKALAYWRRASEMLR
ncbi:MAG: hypothetical protein RL483_958 [Pseudomonadota bacterium]